MPQNLMVGGEAGSRERRGRKLARVALGAAVAALVVCNYSAARAGQDDDESFSDKFLRTLGLRGLGSTEYETNYSERSPLVVPPTRNLPPPVTANVAPAPDWPKDPDVLRQSNGNKKADDRPTPHPYDSVMEEGRPLRPDELNRTGPAVVRPGVGEQSTPSQLGEPKKGFLSFDWLKKEEYGTFTGEPPRVSLTDPPPGYLTPSPDQPYGIAPEKKAYKPATLGERMEPTTGSAGSTH